MARTTCSRSWQGPRHVADRLGRQRRRRPDPPTGRRHGLDLGRARGRARGDVQGGQDIDERTGPSGRTTGLAPGQGEDPDRRDAGRADYFATWDPAAATRRDLLTGTDPVVLIDPSVATAFEIPLDRPVVPYPPGSTAIGLLSSPATPRLRRPSSSIRRRATSRVDRTARAWWRPRRMDAGSRR
jgi:hypothetical protein